MEIVLLRHGMPRIDAHPRLSPAGFGRWISAYNSAGISAGSPPPQNTLERARKCAYVVCSHLPRSTESAKALGFNDVDVCEPMFRELDMPHADWNFPRLSTRTWSILFRLLWAVGYSADAESFAGARERARWCAERLAELASEHGKVLFVGHGSLNWFVARSLKRMGWSGPRKAPRRHWEFGVYRYDAA